MALSSEIEYCTQQDIVDIYPQIDQFDSRRRLYNWVQDDVSASKWYCHNVGGIGETTQSVYSILTGYTHKGNSDLYYDGKRAIPQDVDFSPGHNEWSYDAEKDMITYRHHITAVSPNNVVMELVNQVAYGSGSSYGYTFGDSHLTQIRRKASRLIEARLGKSIVREILKDREGNYPPSIIQATALKSVILFIMAHNPTHNDLIALNEEYDAIMNKIISGKIVMTGHRSENDSKGTIREIRSDPGSDLKPVELRGNYSGSEYELLKIIVDSGDHSQAEGTEMGVATYSVYGKSSTKLKTKQIVKSETINGDYQTTGIDGLYIRWGGGDIEDQGLDYAMELDEYEIELWGSNIQPTVSQVRSTTLSRGTLWQ